MSDNMKQGVTFADKSILTDGFEFHLEAGPQPSRGFLTLREEDAVTITFKRDGHTLTMRDGNGGEHAVEHLYVEDTEDAGHGKTRVYIADGRRYWKNRTITRIYNRLNPDRKTFNAYTSGGSASLGYTFREIVEHLLAIIVQPEQGFPEIAAKYDKAALDKVDTAARPLLTDVVWEFVPAAEALASILAMVGATLSLSTAGNPVVSMPDEDKWSAIKSSLDRYKVSETKPGGKARAVDKPKTVKVYFRTLREKLLKNSCWQPVMQHDGRNAKGSEMSGRTPGEWMPVGDVVGDWGWTETKIRKCYFNLEESLKIAKNDKWGRMHVSAIQSQMYRCFRLSNAGTSSDEHRLQILPLIHSLETYVSPFSGEAALIKPYASDCKMFSPFRTEEGVSLVEAKVPVDAVNVVDEEQGVVAFACELPICPMTKIGESGRLAQDYELGAPDRVQVVVPWIKKFVSVDLDADYYSVGILDAKAALPDNGQIFEVLDDSMYYVERALSGGAYTAYNKTECDAAASLWAERFFGGFKRNEREPCDIDVGAYAPKPNRLCGRLRSVVFSGGEQGYYTTYRLDTDQPLNPSSRSYLDDCGGVECEGHRVDVVAHAKRFGRGGHSDTADKAARGALEHGKKRAPAVPDVYRGDPADMLNPQKRGYTISEDLSKDTGTDHRSKHMRVTAHDGTHPKVAFTHKHDVTPNWGAETWEGTLLAPDSGGPPGVQITPRLGPRQAHRPTDSVSIPGPGQTTLPQRGRTAGADSTHVFDNPPEGSKSAKGPLRDINMVAKHRRKGLDPDGHPICQLEIDKSAMHHRDNHLCGPLVDEGENRRPDPSGKKIWTGQIWDARYRGWVYISTVDTALLPVPPAPDPTPTPPPLPPPGPVPTPSPGPTVTPGPGVPSGGDGGGGGGGPGVQITPGLGPGRWVGGLPWGEGPGGDVWVPEQEPARPRAKGFEPGGWIGRFKLGPISTTPIIENWEPEELAGAAEAGDAAKIVPADDVFSGLFGFGDELGSAGEDWSEFTPQSDMRASLTPSHEGLSWRSQVATPGGSTLRSPLSPGTGLGPNMRFQQRGSSPNFPGTGRMHADDSGRFAIAGRSASYGWSAAQMESEQVSQSEYENMTMGDLGVEALSGLNDLAGRVAELDTRDRKNHNEKAIEKFSPGESAIDCTTPTAYDSQPGIQATPDWDNGGTYVDSFSQNSDDTWNYSIHTTNAAPVGGGEVAVDIKGEVGEGTDI